MYNTISRNERALFFISLIPAQLLIGGFGLIALFWGSCIAGQVLRWAGNYNNHSTEISIPHMLTAPVIFFIFKRMNAYECGLALQALANPDRAKSMQRFFKTGPGQYGEGDQFLGIPVPQQRAIAKQFKNMPLAEIEILLQSPVHEERLTALFLLVAQFQKSDELYRESIVALYLRNTRKVNNWDLVDSSAYQLLGQWLLQRDRALLFEMAVSSNLWERRIAMVSCLAFIRAGEHEDVFALARILLADKHDLMHKAVGWMLKETGKKQGLETIRPFLAAHAHQMPRTMLRYTIEHMEAEERKEWMAA